jgi:hypothetical protein
MPGSRRFRRGAGAPAHPDFVADASATPGGASRSLLEAVPDPEPVDVAVDFLSMTTVVARMRQAFFFGASRARRDDAPAR